MSTWLPQRPSQFDHVSPFSSERVRAHVVTALGLGGLVVLLALQGAALTQSYLWVGPLLCLLALALATDIPAVPTVGIALAVRVLSSQAVSSPRARYSESLNLSGLIAVLFILLAVGLLLHRRRLSRTAIAAGAFLLLSTLVAIQTHGESNLSLREGVREASIAAIPIIVWNARGSFSVPVAIRIVQLAGFPAALIAIYQFATKTGLYVGANNRADGTFTHPNGAAMYFGIAVVASLWRYLDDGRRRLDLALAVVFAIATITTFSVGGLASLLVMLITFGAARPGSLRRKLSAFAVAGLLVAAFLATPLGAQRIETESATSVRSAETRGTANTSLAWRFYKWRTLIPEWERAPLIGRGLGTTVTAEGNSQNVTAGNVPHNEYVRYLVETGVFGLTLLLGGIFAMTRRLIRRRRLPGTSNAAALGLAIVAGCLINACGDNTLLYSTTGYAAGLIVAAVFCATDAAGRARRASR
ncbi:MAG TPA: O-antigen ligase family protein [Solirubrobacteraceae bacterium]|jgi:hypothetical protein